MNKLHALEQLIDAIDNHVDEYLKGAETDRERVNHLHGKMVAYRDTMRLVSARHRKHIAKRITKLSKNIRKILDK